MRFEGDPEVLRNLFRRQRHIQRDGLEQYNYRLAIFGPPGLRRGVLSGGKARPLERRGLHRVFTHIFGTSTGAAGGLYFVAGEMRKHLEQYWLEGASDDFISFKRFMSGRPVQNTRFICEAFRRRLNLKAFYESPVEFWVGVTCARTGKGRFLNAKRKDLHPVDVVRASIAIPGLCEGPVFVDGHPYYDGAGAMSMPMREIVEGFGPTDILVFTNCPEEEKEGMLARTFFAALLRNQPHPVRAAFLSRYDSFAEGIRYLRNQSRCRWAIVWGDNSVGSFERDPTRLQAAADRAECFMERLLLEAEAHVSREFETHPLAAE